MWMLPLWMVADAAQTAPAAASQAGRFVLALMIVAIAIILILMVLALALAAHRRRYRDKTAARNGDSAPPDPWKEAGNRVQPFDPRESQD